MVRHLHSGRKGPQNPRNVVVFVHGYGADGADLLGLGDVLAPHLPDTAFYAPDAPEPCAGNPMGRQWFPIPWLDGSSEAQARNGMLAATDDLNAFLDDVMAREGIGPSQLALVGFSQGTMMSLHLAPRRDQALAAVVGFSGRLLAPDLLMSETKTRPPVLLAHGDEDPVVPFEDMARAADALNAVGFTVGTHVMKHTGHGISPDGLSAALAFLRSRFETDHGAK